MQIYIQNLFLICLWCLIAKSKSAISKSDVQVNAAAPPPPPPPPPSICKLCNDLTPLILILSRSNRVNNLVALFSNACNMLNIDAKMCDGYAKLYSQSLDVSILKNTKINAKVICNLVLRCTIESPKLASLDWKIQLPNIPKPPLKLNKNPKTSAPKLRILHLTDIHLDFKYAIGSVSNCRNTFCCRNDSLPIDGIKAIPAGYWGSGSFCDLPLHTLENMFQHISNNDDIDFIYWTGDLSPHAMWDEQLEDKILYMETLASLFKKYFGNKVVFSAFGNHDSFPANLFPTPSTPQTNITWLYEAAAKYWIQSGLPIELTKDIKKGGFYTAKLSQKTRLVSLNMNYCYNLNFWLYTNPKDPLNQLSWFANILQESEENNEKVHIIGHIPPGSDCLDSFSKAYYEIINRYENTVTAQFFGHSHNDHVEIFYDLNNLKRAINVAYIAPSVTTYSSSNLAYRIYDVDGFYDNTTFQVLDYKTKYLDIDELNTKGSSKWKTEYSALKTYGLKSLNPQDWSDLVDEMIVNPNGDKAKAFVKYYYKSSKDIMCDNTCRTNIICNLKQARSDKNIPCNI